MADNETRVIKIEIDQTQALKDLEQTEVALVNLKNEQKELNDSLKAGTITQNEYAASKVQLDQKIKSETDNRKTLTQTINTESNSIAAQKLKLKELITERDKIDRSTVEGAKKFDQMNGSILQLNGSIKAAEAQGGSFQRNVGNYKGTIDQFTGGAYSAAQGLLSMTKAALAFIATPIGAIIAAIGLALGALMAYFKGSEEGQNRLNKIMAVGSAIMEKVMDVVESLGKAVFEAFSNPKQAMIDLFNFLKDNIINRFTAFATILEGITTLDFKKVANGVIQAGTGVENVIDKVQEFGKQATTTINKAVTDGVKLANMQADLDKRMRKDLAESGKEKLEISELRRKADEAEGENKLKYLNEALALEKANMEEDVANAELRRDIAAEEIQQGDNSKEALNKLAQAEADLDNERAAFFDNTRKMNRERIATEKLIDEGILKRIDSEEALLQKEQDRVTKSLTINEDQLTKSLENIEKKEKETLDSIAVIFDGTAEAAEADKELNDATTENFLENERKKREETHATFVLTMALAQMTASELGGIFNGISQIRAMESKNQLDDYAIQQNKELAVLKGHLDSGLLSKEDYEKRVAQVNEDFAKKNDAIKREAFENNKKNQIAQSRIDQAQIILGAIRSVIGVPLVGAILAAAAAATALVISEVQIQKIKDSQYVGGFSMGGYTGPGGVHDAAGVVHRGEVVWNQRDVAAVGGPSAANSMRPTYQGYAEGGIVANGVTNQIDQQYQNMNQAPPPYISLTELNQAQNSLAQKVQIVEA